MSPSINNYLHHIQDEIRFINQSISGMTQSTLVADEILKRAIVRSLEIIGEAVKQIPDSIRNKYSEIPWRSIAGMRDKLIHQYFGIDYDIVWDVIENHIPPLEAAIIELLTQ